MCSGIVFILHVIAWGLLGICGEYESGRKTIMPRVTVVPYKVFSLLECMQSWNGELAKTSGLIVGLWIKQTFPGRRYSLLWTIWGKAAPPESGIFLRRPAFCFKSVSMRKPGRRWYSSNHRFRSNSAQMLGLVSKWSWHKIRSKYFIPSKLGGPPPKMALYH